MFPELTHSVGSAIYRGSDHFSAATMHAELLRGGAGVYSFAVDIQCDGQTRAKGELMFTAVAQNSIYGETQ